jgi:ribosome biogenesis GTPase
MEEMKYIIFFPEIFRTAKGCKFYNCLHLDEPGCAVRASVEKQEDRSANIQKLY